MAPKGLLVFDQISSDFLFIEVHEIANLLQIDLDPEALNICCKLIEEGANPEALAALIAELHREASSLNK
jgi:mitotic-spindle organizing protein 1